MDLRRCLVTAGITGPEFGRQFAPGQLVDLDEPLGGRPLRDYVNAAWFGEGDPAPRATRTRAVKTEETSDGN